MGLLLTGLGAFLMSQAEATNSKQIAISGAVLGAGIAMSFRGKEQ